MENFKVKEATQSGIDGMKGKIREVDAVELWDMHHLKPDEAIQVSFDVSSKAWIGYLKSEPVVAFGVAPDPSNPKKGFPWLLATDKINEVKFRVIKYSEQYVAEMIQGFEILENFVDSRNIISKEWLAWCGFIICEPCIMGIERVMFNRFWMKGRV
jgi:hypothetical protein